MLIIFAIISVMGLCVLYKDIGFKNFVLLLFAIVFLALCSLK